MSLRKKYLYSVFISLFIIFSCQSRGFALNFSDFSSTAGLTLNGNAVGNFNNGIDANPVLHLANNQTGQAGSAFTNTKFTVNGFSSFFQFRISNAGGINDGTNTGADGIAFVLQNVGSTALGGGGGSLGYAGIGNSVAIEFDTWNNGFDSDSNHLGIDVNGSVTSIQTVSVPGGSNRFDNGSLWSAWIDYDGTTLEVRANQTGIKSALADLSRVIDISTTIGSSDAYVGFTAATGSAFGDHDIVNWNHEPVPEPATIALLGIGLVGLAGAEVRRRRKKKEVD